MSLHRIPPELNYDSLKQPLIKSELQNIRMTWKVWVLFLSVFGVQYSAIIFPSSQ